MRWFFPFPTSPPKVFRHLFMGPEGFCFFCEQGHFRLWLHILNLLLLVFMFKTSGLVEHLKIFWSKTSTISGDVPFSPRKGASCQNAQTLKIFWESEPIWNKTNGNIPNPYPNAPCMEHLPTLGQKWPHSWGNVGKYFLHASGVFFLKTNPKTRFVMWVHHWFVNQASKNNDLRGVTK